MNTVSEVKKKGFFSDTYQMALMAVLIALLILLTFTPLGLTLRIAGVSITFLCIPVAVGAVMIGPMAGLVLGGVFGALSLIVALSGTDPLGLVLLSANPFYTVVACILPRILCGWLAGCTFRLLRKLFLKFNKKKLSFHISAAVACFACSALNTLLFCGMIYLLFTDVEFAGGTVGPIIMGAATLNGIPEAAACLIVGAAICEALRAFTKKRQ